MISRCRIIKLAFNLLTRNIRLKAKARFQKIVSHLTSIVRLNKIKLQRIPNISMFIDDEIVLNVMLQYQRVTNQNASMNVKLIETYFRSFCTVHSKRCN